MKTAMITGITGQDGSYLAEYLLQRGYRVVGFGQESVILAARNISAIRERLHFAYGDLTDSISIVSALQQYDPDELYNLAAQSSTEESWYRGIETGEVTGLGAHRLFDAARAVKPTCRIYQASSSEMFGDPVASPQTEATPFNPVNPYAAAKVYAHHIACIYRKRYGLYIACGILFNHESPRRPMQFITQKVTYGAACAKLGIQDSVALNEEGEPIVKGGKLRIGNLEARRDWGYAPDYVDAMQRMLAQPAPQDLVIGTGVSRSVRELCEQAYAFVGLDWRDFVTSDPRFVRPLETGSTVADASKAKRILNWQAKTSFDDMLGTMIDAHLEQLAPSSSSH